MAGAVQQSVESESPEIRQESEVSKLILGKRKRPDTSVEDSEEQTLVCPPAPKLRRLTKLPDDTPTSDEIFKEFMNGVKRILQPCEN